VRIKSSVTCATEQGPRSHQEDRYFCKRVIKNGLNGILLAVMDGHCGDSTSEFCVKNLWDFFSIERDTTPEDALRKLVFALAKETTDFYAGSTFSVAYMDERHNKVSIAILGDSPVIVIDGKGKIHVSPVHNIRTNLKERKAAEMRGGFYSSDGYICNQKGYGLQMSRSLGDVWMDGVTSREPDIYTIPNPRWVALLTDGIIDFGYKESKKLIGELAKFKNIDADAVDIMSWAKDLILEDNATVVLWKV